MNEICVSGRNVFLTIVVIVNDLNNLNSKQILLECNAIIVNIVRNVHCSVWLLIIAILLIHSKE